MDLFGGEKKSKKTKKTTKTTKTTKSTKDSTKSKTKKSTKTTKTRSKAKGGNFLGSVGDLVAPTGWGPFATAAGLLALDRADAALRRGTKEKKDKMKGGKKGEKKMKGGKCENLSGSEALISTEPIWNHTDNYNLLYKGNLKNNRKFLTEKAILANPQIRIICQNDGRFNLELLGTCGNDTFIYKNDQPIFKADNIEELKKFISVRANQLKFIRSCLKSPELLKKCIIPNS